MANQFTKGTRKKHDEATIDKIRAEVLADRMYKFAKAKGPKTAKHRMDKDQVAAAKVLIERGKPALQAVEQRIVEEPKSDAQILEMIEGQLHTLVGNPAIRAKLKALLDGSTPSLELVAPHQSTAATA